MDWRCLRGQPIPPRSRTDATVQMLVSLTEHGLIYKNRYGKYSFAVPLMGQFIRRQASQAGESALF